MTAEKSFRLLSCNILAGGKMRHYGEYLTQSWRHILPTGRRANLDEFAHIISDFDLVALQEADAGSLRSGFINQVHYLAEAAGFPYWSHQPNRRFSQLTQSSNGLLTRIEPDEIVDYPLPGRIPGRGALWVRFGSSADPLIVVIAHLSLGAKARARQLTFLAELLEKQMHVVLMGDLNCSPHSHELEILFERTAIMPSQHAPLTFPSWSPRRAIDHILVSKELIIEKLWAVPYLVSDHLPIAAEVRMGAGHGTSLQQLA